MAGQHPALLAGACCSSKPPLEDVAPTAPHMLSAGAAACLHVVGVAAQGALGEAQGALIAVAQLPDQHGLVAAPCAKKMS